MEKRLYPNPSEANRRVRSNTQNTSYSQDQFQSFNGGTPQNTGQGGLRLRLKDLINRPPPHRLNLRESTIQSILDTMNGSSQRKQKTAPPSTLLADCFSASVIKIGGYKFKGIHERDLVANFYYAKRKFGWEIFDKDNRIKYKIEVPWEDILAMRAVVEENMPGILEIELAKAPTFFHHINPEPLSHPRWEPSKDFTGGHALKYRRHYFEFPPGGLDKYYQNLIKSDNRLLELSQQPFPTLNCPFFDSHSLLDQGAMDSNNAMSSSSPMHSALPTQGIQSHSDDTLFTGSPSEIYTDNLPELFNYQEYFGDINVNSIKL